MRDFVADDRAFGAEVGSVIRIAREKWRLQKFRPEN